MASAANDKPEIGESIKVWLPGESPWVDVIGRLPDGRILGSIQNDLVFTPNHGYSRDDIATFELVDRLWNVCMPVRQIVVGPSLPRLSRKAMADALRESRRWVEANTAQVRGLSEQAASYGEKMLKQIDAALAPLPSADRRSV